MDENTIFNRCYVFLFCLKRDLPYYQYIQLAKMQRHGLEI